MVNPDSPGEAATPGGTPRTRVRRAPERAVSDPAEADAILDAGFVAHVGLLGEDDQPFVLPMAYARVDRRLYLHGSVASRLLRHATSGKPLCVTVTLLDGLVLARSAFHMSMNYRSVVVLGPARRVEEEAEQLLAYRALIDRMVPGRFDEVRTPNRSELRRTVVVAIELDERSVKVRRGPPQDEPEDLTGPVWAGEVPLVLTAGAPIPDPHLSDDVAIPATIAAFVAGTATT